jgi:hypothetical protein
LQIVVMHICVLDVWQREHYHICTTRDVSGDLSY